MPLDPAKFRSVLGRFASGVTVVTIRDAQGVDRGMTVSAFCSLSLSPPLILVCIDHTAEMYDALGEVEQLAVNILEAGQEAISRRFAEHVGDRFEGIGYSRGVTGAPLISDALAHLECTIVTRHPGGDHTIYVGEVVAAHAMQERPLLYYRGGYTQLER
ncbi:MAG: flavin reductase family protein [Gemmatimonadaceae bacterium]